MKFLLLLWLIQYHACTSNPGNGDVTATDTILQTVPNETVLVKVDSQLSPVELGSEKSIVTGNTSPAEVVTFAKTLMGIPYRYASSDPAVGFDCSGFITYVFNHFNIQVPRSSIDFTDVGKTVQLQQSKPGDLILFTGTDSTIRIVGHMGIIVRNIDGEIEFIQSTSGKQYGVTITPLKEYYMGRFVKVIRIFRQNDG